MAQIPSVLFSTGWTNHQIIMNRCGERMVKEAIANGFLLENGQKPSEKGSNVTISLKKMVTKWSHG